MMTLIVPISQVPVPSELGDKLWATGPLTYLLVVAVLGLTGALIFMFRKYDQNVTERRKDDLQTLEVLKGLSDILKTLGGDATRNKDDVVKEIWATKKVVEDKSTEILSNLRR